LGFQVLEDVGFSGIVVVFSIQLSLKTVSVGLSLGDIGSVGDEFFLDLVQFGSSEEDGSLEFS